MHYESCLTTRRQALERQALERQAFQAPNQLQSQIIALGDAAPRRRRLWPCFPPGLQVIPALLSCLGQSGGNCGATQLAVFRLK